MTYKKGLEKYIRYESESNDRIRIVTKFLYSFVNTHESKIQITYCKRSHIYCIQYRLESSFTYKKWYTTLDSCVAFLYQYDNTKTPKIGTLNNIPIVLNYQAILI